MARSDRLFDLIQTLRDGRLHRAVDLAARMGVTERTIWRDMATLMASGMPVEGERGMGYVLRQPITLPPMMLSATELQVLRQGLRLMAADPDPLLARAARGLAAKVAQVTPAPVDAPDDMFPAAAREPIRAAQHLPLLRRAIRDRQVLSLTYIETAGGESHADIRPLRLSLSGKTWSLIAWVEGPGPKNGGHRALRVDRIMALGETGEVFIEDKARGLVAWASMQPETQSSDPAGS
jgi:predicted DNA-binding transcriptional regulator YafY